MKKKLIVILLILIILSLVLLLCLHSNTKYDENDDAQIEDPRTVEEMENPSELDSQEVSDNGMSYSVPEDYGELRSDNDEYPEHYYQNSSGLGLDVMVVRNNQFKDWDATDASDFMNKMQQGCSSSTDVTVDGHQGKIVTFKEGDTTVEMDLLVPMGDEVYTAVFYGEKNGEAVPITKADRQKFNNFVNSLTFN